VPEHRTRRYETRKRKICIPYKVGRISQIQIIIYDIKSLYGDILHVFATHSHNGCLPRILHFITACREVWLYCNLLLIHPLEEKLVTGAGGKGEGEKTTV
jgi:hypothetical protein